MKTILSFAVLAFISASSYAQPNKNQKHHIPAANHHNDKHVATIKKDSKSSPFFDDRKQLSSIEIKKMDAAISNITKQYQQKIDMVNKNKFISKKDKTKIINGYITQRDKEISLVYQRYNDKNIYFAKH